MINRGGIFLPPTSHPPTLLPFLVCYTAGPRLGTSRALPLYPPRLICAIAWQGDSRPKVNSVQHPDSARLAAGLASRWVCLNCPARFRLGEEEKYTLPPVRSKEEHSPNSQQLFLWEVSLVWRWRVPASLLAGCWRRLGGCALLHDSMYVRTQIDPKAAALLCVSCLSVVFAFC